MQDKNFRYRASFRKLNEARSLTHLQLVRTVRKAMTDAEIPVSRSGNGEPQIAFGPALPMNVQSREEFLDFFCSRYVPPEEFVRRMNQHLHADLAFLDCTQVSRNALALSEIIDGADYLADIRPLDPTHVSAAIEWYHQQSSIEVVKHKTGKVLNLKDFIGSISLTAKESALRVEMRIMEGRTVGIHSVLQSIFSTDQELPVLRERLYIWFDGQKRSPLTLEWELRQMQLHLLDMMT